MDRSYLNNEILVSDNKHQHNHTYGIDLSSNVIQYTMNTCHLCCLFASKCFHESFNAIKSSSEIWKDDRNNFKFNQSALYDIPRCFYLNTNEELYSIKNISLSYESLLRRLPTTSKSRFSQRSSMDSDTIEPIILTDYKLNSNFDSMIPNENDRWIKNYIIPTSTKNSLLHQNNDHFSSSSDMTHSKAKKPKLIDSSLLDNNQRKSKYRNEITINQFIQDINTNIESSIDPPKQPRYDDNLTSSPMFSTENSPFPTVPKCINECFPFNSNKIRKSSDLFFEINLFDSSLFHWQIFNSNQQQYENYFCRKTSLLSLQNPQTSIQSFINSIQSQRQYIPSKYSSWNILFPNYHPIKLSLTKSSLIDNNLTRKNPYGRTGLIGQSLFQTLGPNRYIISLIITQYNTKNYIFLTKNKSHKWELPKTKKVNQQIVYHTLDIAYIDHPLNTDDTWVEVQIILIEDFNQNIHKKNWFALEYLHRLDNIEQFDFDLIKFYT